MNSKYRFWSQEQVNKLLSLYGTIPIEELSSQLGKPIGSLYYILEKEKISTNKNYWSPAEIEFLKLNYSKDSNTELRQVLLRSEDAIQIKAASLGLKKDFYWTQKDKEELTLLFEAGESYKDIATYLQKNISSIHYQLTELNITKKIRRWTEEEKALIKFLANSGTCTYTEIAEKLHAKSSQINAYCLINNLTTNILKSKSRGEEELESLLIKKFGSNDILSQFHIGEKLKLDFFSKSTNLGFEFDGLQHFKETSFFKEDFSHRQYLDKRKNEICFELGITLIRFSYKDKLNTELLEERISLVSALQETTELLKIKETNGKKGDWFFKKEDYKQKQLDKAREYRKIKYQKNKAFLKQMKEKNNE